VTADDPTAAAAELAEQILDVVSSPKQSWSKIAALARELADLAEDVSRRDPNPPPTEET
jgi:hypothetical protein